jgi:hypothetical protein
VNGSSNRIGVVAVDACTPEVSFQDNMLSLPWLQEEPGHSDSERAIDWIGFESRQSLWLGGVAKLVIQG